MCPFFTLDLFLSLPSRLKMHKIVSEPEWEIVTMYMGLYGEPDGGQCGKPDGNYMKNHTGSYEESQTC